MIQDEFGDKGAFKIIKVNFILAQTISDKNVRSKVPLVEKY